MKKTQHRERSYIDIRQTVRQFRTVFQKAVEPLSKKQKAVKGTKLYELQVDFCYLIDSIQRGPRYQLHKAVAKCNEFIDGIVKENAQAAEKDASKTGTK